LELLRGLSVCNMKKDLEQLKEDFLKLVDEVKDQVQLEALKKEFLGRKGALKTIMREMSSLADEERKAMGAFVNEIKDVIESVYRQKEIAIQQIEQKVQIEREWIDVTQPALEGQVRGTLHPVTQVQQDLEDLFASMGFIVADGPELESDFYNFTALNIPPSHPARDMHDTFYIKKHKGTVMRTHTSPVQIRSMRRWGAPLRVLAPGRCFRNEATDVRHEHTFHQLEGLVVDKDISLAHMKGVLEVVAQHLYGKETKIRLRPKFYPFVEPGVNGEVTCFLCKGEGCRLCKNSGWLEIFGAGMVHPTVLIEGGVDPNEYAGFAFGFGLTRLVMLKYGIDDIRHLESGDLNFLKQF
jgi:phenylalanyl-tRNA synthetase alpha chain